MELYKENIDEALFNYFEGNLKESEKEELMNFLHQHPEHNDDFTSWAQSYAHTHEKQEDYGMVEKLTREKQPGAGFNWNAPLLMTLSAVLAILFMLPLKINWPEKSSSSKNNLKIEDPKVKIATSPIQQLDERTIKIYKKHPPEASKENPLPSSPIVSNTDLLDSIRTDKAIKNAAAKDSSAQVTVLENKKADAPIETKNNSASKPVSKKKKIKISIKPSPQFTPISPDL